MAKILIVDDDDDFLKACETVLTKNGYQVQVAHNVTEAEPLAQQGGLDLILLDVMIKSPDDGISFAHKLQKDGNKVPVLILSGVSKVTGYSYQCDETLPCADFIEKPVMPDVLLSKIKAVILK